MWNIKTSLVLLSLGINLLHAQPDIHFFTAKSEIKISNGAQSEEFTAHIRYNMKDTLWVSFTGTFGIEGARMLVTPDSTYIINKLEKTSMAFAMCDENYLIPYAFSLVDWKLILLNMPSLDSSSEQIVENDILITTSYHDGKIQKVYQKNERLLKCEYTNPKRGASCEVIYNQYDQKIKSWPLARERNLVIKKLPDENIHIQINYLDFAYNTPKPFHFNFAKYKNETQP